MHLSLRVFVYILISTFTLLFITGCSLAPGIKINDTIIESSDYEINLSSFWPSEINTTAQYDPIGGYLLLYWIDEHGNACHGIPGLSGKPGAYSINAYTKEAYISADKGQIIPIQDLRQLQEIKFTLDNYNATGLYFVQYMNNIIRERSSGKAIKTLWRIYAVPNITSIEKPFLLLPRVFKSDNTMLMPSIIASDNFQGPGICNIRSLPNSSSVSFEERKKIHLTNFPYGTSVTEW